MNWKNSVLFVLALLLMSPIAFADETNSSENEKNNKYGMQARYDHIVCQTDFAAHSVDNVVSHIPDKATELNPYKDRIATGVSTLKGYLDAMDKEAFNKYVKGTLHPKLRELSKEVRDSYKGKNNRGIDRETKQAIRDQFKTDKKTMATCISNTTKDFAQGKIKHMRDDLKEWNKKIDNLSARGVDVSELKQIIGGAQGTVVEPLDSEVETDAQGATKKFCLGNGCKDGTNFHFFAKMHIARLNALLEYLENSDKNLDETLLAQVKSDISLASSALSDVGTSAYTDQTKAAVWGNIKKASEDMRALVKSARSG